MGYHIEMTLSELQLHESHGDDHLTLQCHNVEEEDAY